MLKIVSLLSLLYSCCLCSSHPLKCKRESGQKIKNPPLTEHLLKCVNDIDGKIIGFHLVLPNDENLLRDYLQKPNEDVEKLLEFLIQINHLRNIIENDNTISLKRKMNTGSSSDMKFQDNLDLARLMTPQSELFLCPVSKLNLTSSPVIRSLTKSNSVSMKAPKDCFLIISKHKSNPSIFPGANTYRYDYTEKPSTFNSAVNSPKDLMKELMKNGGNNYINVFPMITYLQKNDSIDYLTGKLNRSQQELCILGQVSGGNLTHPTHFNKVITVEPYGYTNTTASNYNKQISDSDYNKKNKMYYNETANAKNTVISHNPDMSLLDKYNYLQSKSRNSEVEATTVGIGSVTTNSNKVELPKSKLYGPDEIKTVENTFGFNGKAMAFSHGRHKRQLAKSDSSFRQNFNFVKSNPLNDNSFLDKYYQGSKFANQDDNLFIRPNLSTGFHKHHDDDVISNFNAACKDKLLQILSHAKNKRQINNVISLLNKSISKPRIFRGVSNLDEKSNSSVKSNNPMNSSEYFKAENILERINKFRRSYGMLNVSNLGKINGSRLERSIFMMPHTPGFLNVVIGYPDKSDIGNPIKKMEKIFARRLFHSNSMLEGNQASEVDKSTLDAILKDPQAYQNLMLKLRSSTSNFVDDKAQTRSQSQLRNGFDSASGFDRLCLSPACLKQLRKNAKFNEGDKSTVLTSSNFSMLLPNVSNIGNNINKLAEGLQNIKETKVLPKQGNSSDITNKKPSNTSAVVVGTNAKVQAIGTMDYYSTTYEELLPSNIISDTEASVSIPNVQNPPTNMEEDIPYAVVSNNASIDEVKPITYEPSIISTTESVKFNNEYYSIMQYYNTESYYTVGNYQNFSQICNVTEVSNLERANCSTISCRGFCNATSCYRQFNFKTTTSSGSEYFRNDKNESATSIVYRISSETTEEPDDNEDYSDAEIMPFISVNIFPIMNWRKKQDKAGISLVKDLVAKSTHMVQEEPALPTYFSDLLELLGDRKKNQSSQNESIQRRLESILSGKVSNNDLLKFKLLNILHKSNKFDRLNSRCKEIS